MGQLTRNEVFTLAVQKYSDAVYRAAIHNSRCTADAEDVVQDVYEKLLHYNGTFESEEHLKAWLLRVAINRCRDLTRAAHQKDTELDENLPAPDAFEDGSVLDALLRGVHGGGDRPDDGRTVQHGAELAAACPGAVTYDAEGGDRR